MRFKFILIFFFISSCSSHYTKIENKTPYYTKGLALIYNKADLNSKLIRGKLDNSLLEISVSKLPVGTLIKLINPSSNKSITLKNRKKTNYPDFYKILITKPVAEKLEITKNFPLVEIIEIKKNKSFIAKKAQIFNEEKKISSNAPITSVKISNISKNKKIKKKKSDKKIYILIASFYSKDSAIFLRDRIKKDLPSYSANKIKILRKNNKEINLISGPYSAVNLMKNDYIQLKKFGFEELEIFINK